MRALIGGGGGKRSSRRARPRPRWCMAERTGHLDGLQIEAARIGGGR